MDHKLARLALGATTMAPEAGDPSTGGGAPAKPSDPAPAAAEAAAAKTATAPKPNGNGNGKTNGNGNGAPKAAKKPTEDAQTDDQKKKADALKKAALAEAAAKKAAEAAADAKRASDEAAAAAAEAEGLVVVQSAKRFGVVHEGTIHFIEAGVKKIARALAEHPYAKNHGVEVIGLPISAKK